MVDACWPLINLRFTLTRIQWEPSSTWATPKMTFQALYNTKRRVMAIFSHATFIVTMLFM